MPVSQSEVVTLYETDDDLLVLRYLVVGGEQTDLLRGVRYRLEPGPALEPCSGEEFLSRWEDARSPARSALPDYQEAADGRSEVAPGE